MMALLTFSAHCAKGHDRIDFTDREAFEAHMTGEHKARRQYPGGSGVGTNDRKAPGWTDGRIDKPYAWKAPSRTPASESLERKLAPSGGEMRAGGGASPAAGGLG